MAYDAKQGRAFDPETGISVSWGGRDHSFYGYNDIELVTIAAPGYVVRYSVQPALVTRTRLWLREGPVPTEFVEHPPGQELAASHEWLGANWAVIEAGMLLVYSQGGTTPYRVEARW